MVCRAQINVTMTDTATCPFPETVWPANICIHLICSSLDILWVRDHTSLVILWETLTLAHDSLELLQGTLDMLLLKALQLGPLHGYAIAKRVHQFSEKVFRVEEGSLYPALHRME